MLDAPAVGATRRRLALQQRRTTGVGYDIPIVARGIQQTAIAASPAGAETADYCGANQSQKSQAPHADDCGGACFDGP